MRLGPGLRGLLSSGLLLLGVLLSLVLGPAGGEAAPRLAVVALGAVLGRAVVAAGMGRALGPFADALDLLLGLVLVLGAMALTGGLASELYVLLLVDLVLARACLGAAASRFLALATLLGLGLLAAIAGLGSPGAALGLVLRGLWPLAVLVALELWESRPLALASGEEGAPAGAAGAQAAAACGHDKLLHDLRSPLTVIRLYVDLLDENVRQGRPPRAEHVGNLRAEIDMMNALLQGPEAASPPPSAAFDLLPLLQGLAGTYRVAHEGHVRIGFECEEGALLVAAEPLAVRRAVRNVLDNAVKFTPPGGEVRVRAGRQGREVYVLVSDTGLGVAAEERERVFDARYRGEAARVTGARGSGLGLGLTRELLEAHGGRVSLASQPGRGSEVTIRLPAA